MINTTSDMITVKTLSQRNKNHNNDNLHEYQTGAIKVVDILLSEKFCFLYCFCMEKKPGLLFVVHPPFVSLFHCYTILPCPCVAPGKDAVSNDCIAFYVKYTSIQCNTPSLHHIHVNTTDNCVTHTS